MLTIERLTDTDDAPVYAVRVSGEVLRGLIRHRWGMWTFEPRPYEIRAADTDRCRLISRLPRLLGAS